MSYRKESKLKAKIRALGIPKLWHDVVIVRAGCKCEICGEPAQEAHHITSKRHLHSAWDKLNGIAVCIEHHDPRIVNAWLAENDPERHEYRLLQLFTVHHGVRIEPHKIKEKLWEAYLEAA